MQGDECISHGNLLSAISLYTEVLSEGEKADIETRVSCYYKRSECYNLLGQVDLCNDDLSAVLSDLNKFIGPRLDSIVEKHVKNARISLVQIYLRRAVIRRRMQRCREAYLDFQRAIKLASFVPGRAVEVPKSNKFKNLQLNERVSEGATCLLLPTGIKMKHVEKVLSEMHSQCLTAQSRQLAGGLHLQRQEFALAVR